MSASEIYKYIPYPRDLFRELKAEDFERDQRLCVFFSPDGDSFKNVFNKAVSPCAQKLNMIPHPWFHKGVPGNIMNDILRWIYLAGVVVIDISNRNANVMYELGICHTEKRIHEVVILSREEFSDLPFDLKGVRSIQYSTRGGGIGRLHDELLEQFKGIQQVRSASL